jgi:hypothetical protein
MLGSHMFPILLLEARCASSGFPLRFDLATCFFCHFLLWVGSCHRSKGIHFTFTVVSPLGTSLMALDCLPSEVEQVDRD